MDGYLWPESSEQHLPKNIAEVLRLRAVEPSLCDRSARRFAQDDGLVRVLKKYVSNRLALMGLRPTQGDEKRLGPATAVHRTVALSFVIPQPDVFNLHHKAVILSEAPRRSIAYRRVYGAKSKDLGDVCWQMLFRAFRPQTTWKVKKSQPLSEAEGSAVRFLGLRG
jgi:hypothetical protein